MFQGRCYDQAVPVGVCVTDADIHSMGDRGGRNIGNTEVLNEIVDDRTGIFLVHYPFSGKDMKNFADHLGTQDDISEMSVD